METWGSKNKASWERNNEDAKAEVSRPQNANTPRACQSCHVSKVRCNRPNHDMPCLRCQKSGKTCVSAGKPQRNQQLSNHIMEIKSKIDIMILTAVSQGNSGESSRLKENSADLTASIQSFLEKDISPYLDKALTEMIFNRYVTTIAPTFPAVVFQQGITAADVRRDNPILLLAILDAASSGFCELGVQRKVRKFIVQTYVHCMLRSDQYTLGLLQALVVSATWYRSIEPLEPGEQMDIYQIGHTAANMALIMGLGESLSAKPAVHKEGFLEARRVWLGCYYICSNTSMSLRAPNVMRWTNCMEECLEALESSPDALPSDKVFCRHIRLQHITEEFSTQLSMGDTSDPVQLQAMQTQATHRSFDRQLADWRNTISDGDLNEALEFSYHFSSLYINEVTFCAASGNVASDAEVASNDVASLTVIIPTGAFSDCVKTIDHIFRVFTSLDMSAIRAVPSMHLIRMIYTVLILVKLHFAANSSSNENAQSQVDRLQVSERLNCIIQMFAGWGPLWPATRLTNVFRRIHSWFEDDKTMQQEGSWLNVWRLDSSQTADFDQLSATQMISHDESGSQGPVSWIASLESTDMESVPLSFDSPLNLGLTPPTSSEQVANDPLPFDKLHVFASDDLWDGERLELPLDLEDIEGFDATLGMDLDLSQIPGMRYGSSSGTSNHNGQ